MCAQVTVIFWSSDQYTSTAPFRPSSKVGMLGIVSGREVPNFKHHLGLGTNKINRPRTSKLPSTFEYRINFLLWQNMCISRHTSLVWVALPSVFLRPRASRTDSSDSQMGLCETLNKSVRQGGTFEL